MIKVQITNTENPEMNITLEGIAILCSAVNETGNTQNVKSGVVGLLTHDRIVHLLDSSAKAAADSLGDCRTCRLEAVTLCAKALLSHEESKTEEPVSAEANPLEEIKNDRI